MRYLVALAALALVAVSCAPQPRPVDVAEVQRSIEEANARFIEAFNRHDAAAAVELYTEDAIALPPHEAMVRGRQAIREGMARDMAEYNLRDLQLTTVEVEVSGDFAVEVGNYSISVQPPGMGPMTDRGKYAVVWKQQPDGSWKLHRDIWNTDMPMPQPPAPEN